MKNTEQGKERRMRDSARKDSMIASLLEQEKCPHTGSYYPAARPLKLRAFIGSRLWQPHTHVDTNKEISSTGDLENSNWPQAPTVIAISKAQSMTSKAALVSPSRLKRGSKNFKVKAWPNLAK